MLISTGFGVSRGFCLGRFGSFLGLTGWSRFSLARLRGWGLPGIVRYIPTGALEPDGRTGQQPLKSAAAFGTGLERRVGKLPDLLHASATLRALVLVKRQTDLP